MYAEEATSWRNHIHAGQQGRVPPSRVFRFTIHSQGHDLAGLRETIHPTSPLRYSPLSRMWVARVLLQAPGDVTARGEVAFQLPQRPEPGDCYVPLTAEQVIDAKAQAMEYDPLVKLLTYLEEYESAGPVQVGLSFRWGID